MTILFPAEPPPEDEEIDDRAKLAFLRNFKAKSELMKESIKRRIAALEEKLNDPPRSH